MEESRYQSDHEHHHDHDQKNDHYEHHHDHDHKHEHHKHHHDHDHGHDHHEHHHDHDHGHEHHEHHHDHDHKNEHHEHHHDHEHEGNAPDKRLYALMNYMLSHNADHTKELEQLAFKVKEAGNAEAYEHTMQAVRLFSEGNDALKKALEHMENK